MINFRDGILLAGSVFSLALVLSAPTHAQQPFPNKPITIVVPYGAGGGTDYFARAVSQKMAEKLGQPVIVENKPGAGSAIAAGDVARSTPDGYRILIGDVSTFATNKFLYKKLNYDPVRDFSSITLVGRTPYVLVVNPTIHPEQSLEQMVAAVRAAPPDTFNYASAGLGGPAHLTGAMFEKTMGVTMTHVPYKGAGPALPDLLGGRVGMLFSTYSSIKSHVETNALHALGTGAPSAQPQLPNVPPIGATLPGFEAWFWLGMVAPKETPSAVIDQLREAFSAAVNDPETRQRLAESGIEPMVSSSAQMDDYIDKESQVWSKIIKELNIELN